MTHHVPRGIVNNHTNNNNFSQPNFHNPPPRPDAFFFRERRERVDWRQFAVIDVQKVIRETDIDALQTIVETLTFADIENEASHRYVDHEFVKIVRLCQLTIEYLLHVQDVLDSDRTRLQTTNKSLTAEVERLTTIVSQHQEENLILKKDAHEKKKHLKAMETVLKNPSSLQKLPDHKVFQCPICKKNFTSAQYLETHVERRHPELEPTQIVQNVIAKQQQDSERVENNQKDKEREKEKEIENEKQRRLHHQQLEKLTDTHEKELRSLRERMMSEQDLLKQRLEEQLAQERALIRKKEEDMDNSLRQQRLKYEEELRSFQSMLRKEIFDHRASMMEQERKVEALLEQQQQQAQLQIKSGVGNILDDDEDLPVKNKKQKQDAQVEDVIANAVAKVSAKFEQELTVLREREKEREEKEKLKEKASQKMELERMKDRLAEQDRLERERNEKERRMERERFEKERMERERMEREHFERERIDRENREKVERRALIKHQMRENFPANSNTNLLRNSPKMRTPEIENPIPMSMSEIIEVPEDEPEDKLPAPHIPLQHRPFIQSMFPHSPSQITHTRDGILQTLSSHLSGFGVVSSDVLTKKEMEKVLKDLEDDRMQHDQEGDVVKRRELESIIEKLTMENFDQFSQDSNSPAQNGLQRMRSNTPQIFSNTPLRTSASPLSSPQFDHNQQQFNLNNLNNLGNFNMSQQQFNQGSASLSNFDGTPSKNLQQRIAQEAASFAKKRINTQTQDNNINNENNYPTSNTLSSANLTLNNNNNNNNNYNNSNNYNMTSSSLLRSSFKNNVSGAKKSVRIQSAQFEPDEINAGGGMNEEEENDEEFPPKENFISSENGNVQVMSFDDNGSDNENDEEENDNTALSRGHKPSQAKEEISDIEDDDILPTSSFSNFARPKTAKRNDIVNETKTNSNTNSNISKKTPPSRKLELASFEISEDEDDSILNTNNTKRDFERTQVLSDLHDNWDEEKDDLDDDLSVPIGGKKPPLFSKQVTSHNSPSTSANDEFGDWDEVLELNT